MSEYIGPKDGDNYKKHEPPWGWQDLPHKKWREFNPPPKQKPELPKPSAEIVDKALDLINGDRAKEYGPALDQYTALASMWSGLTGTSISAEQAILMMAALKVLRAYQQMPTSPIDDTAKPLDSLIDLVGYTSLIEKTLKQRGWWSE